MPFGPQLPIHFEAMPSAVTSLPCATAFTSPTGSWNTVDTDGHRRYPASYNFVAYSSSDARAAGLFLQSHRRSLATFPPHSPESWTNAHSGSPTRTCK